MGNSGKLFKIQETYGNATASLLGLYKNFMGIIREPGGKTTRTVRQTLRELYGKFYDPVLKKPK